MNSINEILAKFNLPEQDVSDIILKINDAIDAKIIDSRLQLSLNSAGVKNITAAKALLNYDDITLDNLEDAVSNVKQQNPFLFNSASDYSPNRGIENVDLDSLSDSEYFGYIKNL